MKKLLLIIVPLLLVGCQNNGGGNSNSSTVNSEASSDISIISETSLISNTSTTSEISLSSEISTTSETSATSEEFNSSFENEQTAKDRHDFYLEYSKVSKDIAIPIQGKFIGYEQYQNNPNCNGWFQEGKYGYYVINLPLSDVELGKSYYIYGLSLERDYYGINAKTDYYYCVEELNGFETEIINLNEETPSNDDYIGSQVIIEGVVESINDNVITMVVNGETYSLSYNKNVISASDISSKWSQINQGDNVSFMGILHANNREIRIINPSSIIIKK